jgi:hypothetical protein
MDFTPLLQGMGAAGVFLFAAALIYKGLLWPKPVVEKMLTLKDEGIAQRDRRIQALELENAELRKQNSELLYPLTKAGTRALEALHELAARDKGAA